MTNKTSYLLLGDSPLADAYESLLSKSDELEMIGKGIGDSTVSSSHDAKFSGTVFIYHESEMPAEQVGDLTRLFRSKNVHVQFRSSAYLSFKKMQIQADK